jgi:hypothetical protein
MAELERFADQDEGVRQILDRRGRVENVKYQSEQSMKNSSYYLRKTSPKSSQVMSNGKRSQF